MNRKITNYLAASLLAVMFILLFFSAQGDSATMDELAHIPAGYSYLSQKDYRLNPEHPPLIKDLSALPLMFLNLNFPTDAAAWKTYINGQWDMGRIFIYESGNNADTIIHFARLPIMLLAILFGWLFFCWVRSFYGNAVALLALFLFAFSPTFLAHSKYVTTDLGAAFGFFIGLAAFLQFLMRGTKKSLMMAGVCFGVAQLLKFSLMILAPLYILLGILWVFLKNFEEWHWKQFFKEEFKMLFKIFLIGLIGLSIIWIVYLFHIWKYPIERQQADTTFLISSFQIKPLANLTIWLSRQPVLRGLGQYLLGLLMVLQRSAGGNTTYFMGEVSAIGWKSYFPILYFFKEHLAFHLLTLIALLFGIKNMLVSKQKNLKNIFNWMKENFALTTSLIFIAIYWLQAISSPLNIGLRHILPTFPFIYLLVSRQIVRWEKDSSSKSPRILRIFIVGILLMWIFVSAIITFPHYLSYYNALAGGTQNGYQMATDSNYDWGQDLRRLKQWTDKNLPASEKIAIDYFGGGNPQYYFGEQYQSWSSSKGSPTNQGIRYFAVSLTFLQGSQAKPVNNFIQKPEDTYSWLLGKKPVATAGTSIFIYKF